MITPYDWQEGIGNRAQYIEAKLAQGAPVVALSLDEGILLVTYRRQTRKLFEVYDRLAYAGIGQQSDVEAIRLAAVDFASKEGYQRSEEDVTVQRVATAMSQPVKRAFADFSTSPFVVKCLFAELNATPATDTFFILDYTGDYILSRGTAVLAGTDELTKTLLDAVENMDRSRSADALLAEVQSAWKAAITPEGGTLDEAMAGLRPEAMLIERVDTREDRFRLLTPED